MLGDISSTMMIILSLLLGKDLDALMKPTTSNDERLAQQKKLKEALDITLAFREQDTMSRRLKQLTSRFTALQGALGSLSDEVQGRYINLITDIRTDLEKARTLSGKAFQTATHQLDTKLNQASKQIETAVNQVKANSYQTPSPP